MTREGRIVKLVREKAKKDQEAAKAREDLLLQKQQELEAALKRQEALIAQLMNNQPNPYEHTIFFVFTSVFCLFIFKFV